MYYYTAVTFVAVIFIWVVGSYLVIMNLEEPKYSVLEKKDGYEIRLYEPYIIAETEVVGEYQESMSNGFRLIADYIFGNNTTKNSIAMTVPVIQGASEKIDMTTPVINTLDETTGSEKRRTVSFVLPSRYTLETLPKPNNSTVTIREVPARKVAVIRFTGYATEKRIEDKKKILEYKLNIDKIEIQGVSQVAQYNPPASFPLTRRNEILIQIRD